MKKKKPLIYQGILLVFLLIIGFIVGYYYQKSLQTSNRMQIGSRTDAFYDKAIENADLTAFCITNSQLAGIKECDVKILTIKINDLGYTKFATADIICNCKSYNQ